MHVAAAIVCLILIIVLIKRLAFRQRPSDAPGVHSKHRVWILPLADRIPSTPYSPNNGAVNAQV